MDIQAEKYQINLTHNELWTIAFDLKNYLLSKVKSHWVHHQERWKKGEEERLYRCRRIFSALGRCDLYEDMIEEAEDILKKHNESKSQ